MIEKNRFIENSINYRSTNDIKIMAGIIFEVTLSMPSFLGVSVIIINDSINLF